MCGAGLALAGNDYGLVCDIVHSDEWHYDQTDDVTWKEGRGDD
jgi:hypothetical protein